MASFVGADLTDASLHVFHAVPSRSGVIDEDKKRPGPLRHIERRNSFQSLAIKNYLITQFAACSKPAVIAGYTERKDRDGNDAQLMLIVTQRHKKKWKT